jgi:hypothetical protein
MDLIRRSVALTILLTTFSTTLFAGSVTSTVNFVQVNTSQNRAYIRFTTNPSSQPSCATDPRMTVSLSTHGGRAVFNMALTAKASGKRLYAAGTGTCNSRYEQINYARLL